MTGPMPKGYRPPAIMAMAELHFRMLNAWPGQKPKPRDPAWEAFLADVRNRYRRSIFSEPLAAAAIFALFGLATYGAALAVWLLWQ